MVQVEENGVKITTTWDTETWEETVKALLRTVGNQSQDVEIDRYQLQLMMGLVEELVLPSPLTEGKVACTAPDFVRKKQ